MNSIKIIHIITGLGDGGAEHTLYKICKYDNLNNHIVISLKGSDKYSTLLKKIGIKVYHLEMNFLSIRKFIYLLKLLKFLDGNIIQTWLIHGDLIGGLAAKLAGFDNRIWNVLALPKCRYRCESSHERLKTPNTACTDRTKNNFLDCRLASTHRHENTFLRKDIHLCEIQI